jgi:HEAT repeat protein
VSAPHAPTAPVALALALLAAPAAADAAWLADARLAERAVRDPAPVVAELGGAEPEWLAWTVPALPEATELCCFGDGWRRRSCSLAGRDQGWGTARDGAAPTAPSELRVLVEVERGRPMRVEAMGPLCSVEGARRRVTLLTGVEPERSLAFLRGLAAAPDAGRGDGPAEMAVAAIAYHAAPAADAILAALAGDRRLDGDRREQVLVWSGQLRGRAGYELLDRTLAGADERELREHAIFALTQSPVPEAAARIRRAAREDRDPELRGQALFWLAQEGGGGAEVADLLLERIAEDPDAEVREQGVFALSQLDDGTDHLIRLLRESRDREVRRQALFWLGQSDDPRAVAELARLLEAD